MKDALDVVLAWQLRNPSVTDPADAIEEVKKTSKSELPSRLIFHFLTLTIRPLFSQTKRDAIGDAPAPWKTRENHSFLDLLHWCIRAVEEKDLREWFRLMRPPIFRMLEDSDLEWKAKACQLINHLMEKAPENIKEECRELFSGDLFGCFNYLPTLTPAPDAVGLLEHVYSALISFVPTAEKRSAAQESQATSLKGEKIVASSTLSEKDVRFLDKIVRRGTIAVLHHAPTPTTYPELTTLVLHNLSRLIVVQEIEWVKHANDIMPLLHNILRDEFGPAHPDLPQAAINCLRMCIAKGWPRMGMSFLHVNCMSFIADNSSIVDIKRLQEIYLSTATAWVNCSKYDTNLDSLDMLRCNLKDFTLGLESVFKRDDIDVDEANWWTGEKERARKEDAPWSDMLEACSK